MKTNYHSPWAKVKIGNGYKLAWIESYHPDTGIYRGKAARVHWQKLLRYPVIDETHFYKTRRNYSEGQVIATWRNCPSPYNFAFDRSKFTKL